MSNELAPGRGWVRVYTADTPAEAWHIRNVLEQHSIEARLRNGTLFGATGEVPMLESLPEVWVRVEAQVEAAQLIKEIRSRPARGAQWRCRNCGEVSEAVFAVCWQCGVAEGE